MLINFALFFVLVLWLYDNNLRFNIKWFHSIGGFGVLGGSYNLIWSILSSAVIEINVAFSVEGQSGGRDGPD